jgi:hypothetical protein
MVCGSRATNQESSDDVCPIPRQGGNNNFYEQFYEDYILSIVFSDIEKGFYVDVGANSPDFDSITKHFYLLRCQIISLIIHFLIDLMIVLIYFFFLKKHSYKLKRNLI